MNKDRITTAAEYICIQFHPEEIRGDYVRNIRVHYHAEEIVYLLQALSTGMTGLFIGLLTNHLYDKTRRPDQRLVDIEKLLRKQQKTLKDLERLIAKEKDKDFAGIAQQHLDSHRKALLLIHDSDPYVSEMIRSALLELKSQGQEALSDEINSYLD